MVLKVYDVSGRAVARLADRVFDAGRHRLSWDGRNLRSRPVAAGVYFLELEAGEAVQRAKITVLR